MDQADFVTPYEHIDVVVGEVAVRARPVKWDSEIVDGEGHNADGELAKPTEYEGVCPECGQMIHFPNNLKGVKCPECDEGEDVISFETFEPFQDPGAYGEDQQAEAKSLDGEAEGLGDWDEAAKELDLDADPDEPAYEGEISGVKAFDKMLTDKEVEDEFKKGPPEAEKADEEPPEVEVSSEETETEEQEEYEEDEETD